MSIEYKRYKESDGNDPVRHWVASLDFCDDPRIDEEQFAAHYGPKVSITNIRDLGNTFNCDVYIVGTRSDIADFVLTYEGSVWNQDTFDMFKEV